MDTSRLKAVLQSGLDWIWESEHPEGALIQHHGIWCTEGPFLDGRVKLRIIPEGHKTGPVVVFDLHEKEYGPEYELLNPFTKDEIDLLRSLVVACGSDVVDEWNGEGYATVSLSPARRASHGVLQLVDTYRQGCPEHPRKGVFCNCGWFSAGKDKVRFPEGWH
jgi:hypothetical protein